MFDSVLRMPLHIKVNRKQFYKLPYHLCCLQFKNQVINQLLIFLLRTHNEMRRSIGTTLFIILYLTFHMIKTNNH